jgi:hypothetical protein
MRRLALFLALWGAVADDAAAAPDAGGKEAWERDLKRARSRQTLGIIGGVVGISILAASATAFCTAGVCDSESEKWTGLAVGAAGFGIAAFSVVSWVDAKSEVRTLEEDGRTKGYARRPPAIGVQLAFRF